MEYGGLRDEGDRLDFVGPYDENGDDQKFHGGAVCQYCGGLHGALKYCLHADDDGLECVGLHSSDDDDDFELCFDHPHNNAGGPGHGLHGDDDGLDCGGLCGAMSYGGLHDGLDGCGLYSDDNDLDYVGHHVDHVGLHDVHDGMDCDGLLGGDDDDLVCGGLHDVHDGLDNGGLYDDDAALVLGGLYGDHDGLDCGGLHDVHDGPNGDGLHV